jgi:hypothetical protein
MLDIPATPVAALTIESYLSHAADLADGTPAGQLECVLPMAGWWPCRCRWGWIPPSGPTTAMTCKRWWPIPGRIATTFPARSGFPPRDHEGHTYRAAKTLDAPLTVTAVRWVPALPEAFVRIERVRLADGAGGEQLWRTCWGWATTAWCIAVRTW